MADGHSPNIVGLVSDLLDRAVISRATDVHFEPGDSALLVRFRVDGVLREIDRLPIAITPNIIARLKVLASLLTYRTDTPQEGSFAHARAGGATDIRVATFPTIRGERVVLRLLPAGQKRLHLDDLGHSAATTARLRAACRATDGMLIVCGPVGSGKTTTLHALLDEIRRARPGASIFAIEDPVEMRIDSVTQTQIEPARGLTYAVALRSLLRQDPQVLMVGEIRDAEVAQIAAEAALTGHLLLTTLHSGQAVDAIVRLREMGLAPYQITSALRGVISQRLVRTICECRAAGPAVCTRCGGSGYAGRTAIGQFVEMTQALRDSIIADADSQQLRTAATCASLRDDAARLLSANRTTKPEIDRVLGDGA
ncbi:MAG: Flp pilus assembly complex ATPase component TadA [Phycisphaerales bacterium]|nr:Flp pilus assembly complex ATPase component TadA [Phycisphaerales bacterium]